MPVVALVLEAPDEVAAGALVGAHDAEGVERCVAGKGPLVVDQEELAGVPTAGVGARPGDAVRAGVAAGLVGSAVGRSLSPPLTDYAASLSCAGVDIILLRPSVASCRRSHGTRTSAECDRPFQLLRAESVLAIRVGRFLVDVDTE